MLVVALMLQSSKIWKSGSSEGVGVGGWAREEAPPSRDGSPLRLGGPFGRCPFEVTRELRSFVVPNLRRQSERCLALHQRCIHDGEAQRSVSLGLG